MLKEITQIHTVLKEQSAKLNALIEAASQELPTPMMVLGADGKQYNVKDLLDFAANGVVDAILNLENAQLLFIKP